MRYVEVSKEELFDRYTTNAWFDHEPTELDLEEINTALKRRVELEAYLLGEKPLYVRIDDGAYAGSIFQVKVLNPTRHRINPNYRDKTHIQVDFVPAAHNGAGRPRWHAIIASYVIVPSYTSNQSSNIIYRTDGGKEYVALHHGNCQKQFLLDYNGPTIVKHTRNPKVVKQAPTLPTSFTDALGNTINVGDYAIFSDSRPNGFQLVKFEGYATPTRLRFFVPSSNAKFGKEYTKGRCAFCIKVEVDDISISTSTLLDKTLSIRNMVAPVAKLTLKELTG